MEDEQAQILSWKKMIEERVSRLERLVEAKPETARVRKLFDLYREIHGKNGRYTLDTKRRRKLEARIREGRSDEEFEQAFRGVLKSQFHVENKYTDLELICRDAPHFDRFLETERQWSAGRDADARKRERSIEEQLERDFEEQSRGESQS